MRLLPLKWWLRWRRWRYRNRPVAIDPVLLERLRLLARALEVGGYDAAPSVLRQGQGTMLQVLEKVKYAYPFCKRCGDPESGSSHVCSKTKVFKHWIYMKLFLWAWWQWATLKSWWYRQ